MLFYLLTFLFRARLRAHAETINDGATLLERITLQRRRTALLERINAWKVRSPDNLGEENEQEDEDILPEDLKLPLPSALLGHQNAVLQEIEKQLRESIAFDCLRALRKCLSERIALQREKDRYLQGQADNFRSQAALKRVKSEIDFVAMRYNAAYTALEALGGNINPELMRLEPEDVSAANVFDYTRQLGRGANTKTSWIWRQTAVGAQAQDDNWLEESECISSVRFRLLTFR